MKSKSSLTIIFITVFIDLMGFGILIPILPTFASKVLFISDFEIGITIAVFSLMQFFFNPILGRISDKIGRKPIILITLLLTAISYIIFSFATSFLLLIISRMLAGLGGSNIGVAQAYIADVTTKENRAKGMGIIGAAFGLGFVFGPLLGGILSSYSYQIAGFGAAAFSFMAFLFAAFILPESLKEKSSLKNLDVKLIDTNFSKRVLKMPVVGLLIYLFFIIVFSMANIYGTFAILGYKKFGFSDQENGYLYGIIGLVSAIIQGGAIRFISKKFKERNIVLVGLVLMMLGLGMLPYGMNFTGVGIIVVVLSMGTGVLQPTIMSMISKYSPEDQQGAILGLSQSFSAFARVLGPVWGGFAFDYIGFQFPFLTGAAFTLLTLFITIFMLSSTKLKEATENV